eukprot:scaffold13717_cov132-Isochrysis_galbana.AAC.8
MQDAGAAAPQAGPPLRASLRPRVTAKNFAGGGEGRHVQYDAACSVQTKGASIYRGGIRVISLARSSDSLENHLFRNKIR